MYFYVPESHVSQLNAQPEMRKQCRSYFKNLHLVLDMHEYLAICLLYLFCTAEI